jgi:hypothetical protein
MLSISFICNNLEFVRVLIMAISFHFPQGHMASTGGSAGLEGFSSGGAGSRSKIDFQASSSSSSRDSRDRR